MISGKRITQLAKKWQRMAALRRKRVTSSSVLAKEVKGSCSTSSVAGRGCCIVYTTDGTRFEVPLVFLGTAVFNELLQMSHEEFGFVGGDGRITLPCDVAVMEYAMSLLRRSTSAEMEAAFLSSMAMPCHYAGCAVPPIIRASQQIFCL